MPDAPRLLGAGRIMAEPGLADAEKLELIVDTAELCSCRRRIRQIRAALRSSADAGEGSDALFAEATALQRRVNELTRKLSAVPEE